MNERKVFDQEYGQVNGVNGYSKVECVFTGTPNNN